MSASLVGSEMCIRDRHGAEPLRTRGGQFEAVPGSAQCKLRRPEAILHACLLYTSDAADDM
eukprot:8930033-Alexandrium_andersonii.AAC.1